MPEGRNQSLFASLEFSRRHLSPAARWGLPWLGLFRGGVFEINLLDVSQLDPAAWESIRRELQAIALVRPEDDIQITGRLFLRFHPTLASAAADAALAQQPETRRRFIDVYLCPQVVRGPGTERLPDRVLVPAILDREEANYRTAVHWALADRQFRAAAAPGRHVSRLSANAGRLRERDAWVQWLKDVVTQQGFTREAATYERQHAYTRFTQGDPQGAVQQLQALIQRLRYTTEFDPAFQLALAIGDLGRILYLSGAPTQAIRILRESIGLWEALVEKNRWPALGDAVVHAGPRQGRGRTGEPLRHDGRFGQCPEGSWSIRRGPGRGGEGSGDSTNSGQPARSRDRPHPVAPDPHGGGPLRRGRCPLRPGPGRRTPGRGQGTGGNDPPASGFPRRQPQSTRPRHSTLPAGASGSFRRRAIRAR